MSFYFSGYDKLNVTQKEQLRMLATQASSRTSSGKNPFPDLITSFLLKGKLESPVAKDKELEVPLLPKRTGNVAQDKENIIGFLGELCDKFMLDAKNRINLVKAENSTKVNYVSDIINKRADYKTETLGNNMEIDNKNSSTYTKYQTYSQALIAHESREKPKWWQLGKRFNHWQESKSLKRMEQQLKARGVKLADLENAKNHTPTSKEFFKPKENLHDLLIEAKKELGEAQKYVPDDFRISQAMKSAKPYIQHSMKAFQILKQNEFKSYDPNNEFEKKDYNEFHKLLNGFDEKMKEDMDFDMVNLEDLKRDALNKGFRKNVEQTKTLVQFKENEFDSKIQETELDLEHIDEKQLDEHIEHSL